MTFKFNNPKPGDKFVRRDGDVVEYERYLPEKRYCHQVGGVGYGDDGRCLVTFYGLALSDIIAEYAPPQQERPKTFGEMTEAEQLALYRAENNGGTIEILHWDGAHTKPKGTRFIDFLTYRIVSEPEPEPEPEPEVETIVLYGARSADGDWIFSRGSNPDDDACITFRTIDGKIDASAPVTLEELK